jgi:hypothetical protein
MQIAPGHKEKLEAKREDAEPECDDEDSGQDSLDMESKRWGDAEEILDKQNRA